MERKETKWECSTGTNLHMSLSVQHAGIPWGNGRGKMVGALCFFGRKAQDIL